MNDIVTREWVSGPGHYEDKPYRFEELLEIFGPGELVYELTKLCMAQREKIDQAVVMMRRCDYMPALNELLRPVPSAGESHG